jgi:hypothetical protein
MVIAGVGWAGFAAGFGWVLAASKGRMIFWRRTSRAVRERSPSGWVSYRRDFPILRTISLARSFFLWYAARRGPYSDLKQALMQPTAFRNLSRMPLSLATISGKAQRPAPPVFPGVMHNDFDAENVFAFAIDLQRHLSVVDLEDRHIMGRCLDHDSPCVGFFVRLS